MWLTQALFLESILTHGKKRNFLFNGTVAIILFHSTTIEVDITEANAIGSFRELQTNVSM